MKNIFDVKTIGALIIVSLSLLLIPLSCAPLPVKSSKHVFMLGTSINLTIYSSDPEKHFSLIVQRLSEIENLMSVQKPDSELTRINNSAGIEALAVSPDTWKVIQEALRVAEASGGSYDPTVGPLVNAWGIGSESPRIPTQEEIHSLLELVDYRNVILDEQKKTVFLKKKGMRLDLGGIAKGYAADEAARICRENGIQSAVLDLGGNIILVGSKPLEDGSLKPWSIGIQKPEMERGTILGIFKSVDSTLVTSGDYERFFEKDGVRYHHIIDPKTGYPARSGLVQASIFSKSSSMTCDGFSTAVFVLGKEKGLELIETQPEYSALVVDMQQQLFASSGFPLSEFTLKEEGYTVNQAEKKILNNSQ